MLRPNYPVTTSRLRLRLLEESDLGALVAYHSIPQVHQYLPNGPMDAQAMARRLRHEDWTRASIEEEGQFLNLGVQLVESGALIGDVMLRWVSSKNRCGEIGYVLHPHYCGNGYGTEAAWALLQLAFEEMDLHRVIARVDARNTASIRLCGRLGMRQEAFLVQNLWEDEGWTDEVDFAILQSEWQQLPKRC